jgi:hypothetical protein
MQPMLPRAYKCRGVLPSFLYSTHTGEVAMVAIDPGGGGSGHRRSSPETRRGAGFFSME